jgi:plasmid stability protein
MYHGTMPVMLQVRNLPDDVHAKLKQRAREAGMSLSDYVAEKLADLVKYRSNAEILEDARKRAVAAGIPERLRADGLDGAEMVRRARAERDEELFGEDGVYGPHGMLSEEWPERRRKFLEEFPDCAG